MTMTSMFARLSVAVAGFWLMFCSQAMAQDKQPYFPAKDNYRIFVVGDSLAAGLGLGLMRLTDGDTRLSVDGRYKEDSGLARPEFYDWNDSLPKILESNQIDIAVILIGSNDSRDIRSSGLRFVFGTQEWTNAYVSEIDKLIDGLKRVGVAVYWVELPPMQSDTYNAAMKAISIVQRERTDDKGVRYIETVPSFSKNGAYIDIGDDGGGNAVRLRDRDGVHLSKAGNDMLARLALNAIRADIAAADRNPKLANPEGPVFGQEPANGAAANTIIPETGPNAGQPVEARTAQAPSQTTQAQTSSADRLFTLGEAAEPPAGRFDDFRLPQ